MTISATVYNGLLHDYRELRIMAEQVVTDFNAAPCPMPDVAESVEALYAHIQSNSSRADLPYETAAPAIPHYAIHPAILKSLEPDDPIDLYGEPDRDELKGWSPDDLKVLMKDWYQAAVKAELPAKIALIAEYMGESSTGIGGGFLFHEGRLHLFVNAHGACSAQLNKISSPVVRWVFTDGSDDNRFIPGEWVKRIDELYPLALKAQEEAAVQDVIANRAFLLEKIFG